MGTRFNFICQDVGVWFASRGCWRIADKIDALGHAVCPYPDPQIAARLYRRRSLHSRLRALWKDRR